MKASLGTCTSELKPDPLSAGPSNNGKHYLRDGDGVKVQRANFDLLEEEVELGAPRGRLAAEGQRVAVRELPLDAGLEAYLVDPGAWRRRSRDGELYIYL